MSFWSVLRDYGVFAYVLILSSFSRDGVSSLYFKSVPSAIGRTGFNCGRQVESVILSSGCYYTFTHTYRVCGQHSFGFPLRLNGMHRTRFAQARLDLLSLVI